MIAFMASLIFAANISYGQHNHGGVDSTNNLQTDKAKDPVCGMEVAKNDSLMVLYNEKEYFFCSNKHMLAFLKQPQKFTSEQSQNTQKMDDHKMDDHDHGMMGMSMPLMIIMGGVMVAAMVVGMTHISR